MTTRWSDTIRATTGRNTKPGSSLLVGVLVVTLLFGLFQLFAAPGTDADDDTLHYGRMTLKVLGKSTAEAEAESIKMVCARRATAWSRESSVNPVGVHQSVDRGRFIKECTAQVKKFPLGGDERFLSIFDTRPGYPYLAAPFVAVLGLAWGMWMTSLLCVLAAAALVALSLRTLGLSVRTALVGQILFLLLPSGPWGVHLMTEGAMLMTTMMVVYGAVLLQRGRIVPGAVWNVAGFALGFAVKSSQVTLLAAGICGAALACLVFMRRERTRGNLVLAGISGVATILAVILPKLWGWAGVDEALQDNLSVHYSRPEVADPWYWFMRINANYWQWLGRGEFQNPWLLVVLAACVWVLARYSVSLALLVGAVAATAVLTMAIHPTTGPDVMRFSVPLWIFVAFAGAVFSERLRVLPVRGADPQAPTTEETRQEAPVRTH